MLMIIVSLVDSVTAEKSYCVGKMFTLTWAVTPAPLWVPWSIQ